MIRADVLSGCPIYLFGLVRVLRDAGVTVLRSRTSLHEGTSSILADTVVIDADLLEPQGGTLAPIALHTPVLVVNHNPDTTPDPFLAAGATAIVTRNETSERVVSAVLAVGRGQFVPPCTATTASRSGPSPAPDEPSLSDREEQVLRHIARGLTHGQIATRIGISPHTVDTYVKRIRVKLGAGNKAELTRLALLRARTAAPVPASLPAGSAADPASDPAARPAV